MYISAEIQKTKTNLILGLALIKFWPHCVFALKEPYCSAIFLLLSRPDALLSFGSSI